MKRSKRSSMSAQEFVVVEGGLALVDRAEESPTLDEVYEDYFPPSFTSKGTNKKAAEVEVNWSCSCGGPRESCQGEAVQCLICSDKHHEACALDLLKGSCPIAKYALLRPETFQCWSCNPDRYTWLFQCSCLGQGLAVVANFDDDTDMVECVDCRRWSHTDCKYSTPDIAASVRKDVNTVSAKLGQASKCAVAGEEADAETLVAPHRCLGCRTTTAGVTDGEGGSETKWYRFEDSSSDIPEVVCASKPIEISNDSRFTPIRTPESVLVKCNDESGRRIRFSKFPRLKGLYLRSGLRDEKIVNEVIVRGVYERPIFDFEITASDTWLDLGAHVGVFTSLALVAGARVIAVEPELSNFRLLEMNSQLNSTYPDQICLVQSAVVGALSVVAKEERQSVSSALTSSFSSASSSSSSCSTSESETHSSAGRSTTLYLHPGIAFRHTTLLRRRRMVWDTVQVPATTLKCLLDKHPTVTSVKCDIQGSEVGVINSIIDWKGVKNLVFEYDFEYSPDCASFHAFIRNLRAHFPYIHHAKVPEAGPFRGFPNGVVVFAKVDQPAKWATTGNQLSRAQIGATVGKHPMPHSPLVTNIRMQASKTSSALPTTPVADLLPKNSSMEVKKSAAHRPKRRCVGQGVTNTFDATAYTRDFKYARSAASYRQGALDSSGQQLASDIEDEDDEEDGGGKVAKTLYLSK